MVPDFDAAPKQCMALMTLTFACAPLYGVFASGSVFL